MAIQDFLISAKEALKINLYDTENKFLACYNERMHSTIGYTPREIVDDQKYQSSFKMLNRIKLRVGGSRKTRIKSILYCWSMYFKL